MRRHGVQGLSDALGLVPGSGKVPKRDDGATSRCVAESWRVVLAWMLAALMALACASFAMADEAYPSYVADDATVSTTPANNASTENIGRVWTDKTVATDDLELSGQTVEKGDSDFLVALSASSSRSSVTDSDYKPLEIVLLLDVSGSMENELSEGYEEVYTLKTNETYYIKSDYGNSYRDVRYNERTKSWGYWSGGGWTPVTPKQSATDTTSGRQQFYTKVTLSRLDALKNSVEDFINETAKNNKNIPSEYQTKISIVKFAGDKKTSIGNDTYDVEMGLGPFTYTETYNYTQIVTDLTVCDEKGAADLIKAVKALNYGGATSADFGMELVEDNLFNTNANNSNQVLILFTDGEPTHGSEFSTTVANDTISAAKNLKDKGVEIYSLGTLTGGNISDTQANINKYMNYVSSNFPDASSMNNGGTRGSSKYYQLANNASELNNIFTDIQESLSTDTGFPTEVPTGADYSESGYISFRDQLGDYMHVDSLKAVVFAGTRYSNPSVSTEGSTTTYTFAGTANNPSYGTVDLSDLIVKVTSGGDLKTGDVVEVQIPASLIPLRYVTADMLANPTTFSLTPNTPISIVYGVSLKDGVEDLLINPDDAMKGYIEANSDSTGLVSFYTNSFTAGQSAGNTTATFTPSAKNPFYYFAADQQLYTDSDCTQAANRINNNRTYYYQYVYYTQADDGSAQQQVKSVAISGSDLNGGSIQTENKDGKLYIKKGSRHTALIANVQNAKATNATGTATLASTSSWGSDGVITTYLGNNGRVQFKTTGSLTVTKTVAGAPGDFSDVAFPFTATLTAPDGQTVATSYKASLMDADGNPIKVDAQGNPYALDKDGNPVDASGNPVSADAVYTMFNLAVTPVASNPQQGTVAFNLKGGQSIVIYGIAEGVTYTVLENAGAAVPFFTTTKTGDTGTIAIQTASEAAFTNTYAVGELEISKTVTGYAPENQEFDFKFELTGTEDATVLGHEYSYVISPAASEDPEPLTVKHGDTITLKAGEKATISGLPLGIQYQVTEQAIENGAWSVTPETGIQTGTISATLSQAPFTNVYTAQTTDGAGLVVTKTLNGRDMLSGEFSFTIQPTISDATKLAQWVALYPNATATSPSAANGVAGKVAFAKATEDYSHVFSFDTAYLAQAVEYGFATRTVTDGLATWLVNYTVSEQIDATTSPQVSATSPATYALVLKVVDQGDGTLVATLEPASYITNNAVAFVNAYTAVPASLGLSGTKTIDKDHAITAGDYSFTLATADSATAAAVTAGEITMPTATTVSVDASANWAFGNIVFAKAGTYAFQITENDIDAAKLPGVQKDQTVIQVSVTVTDNNGQLVATVNDAPANGYVFNNTYTPGDAVLEGDSALKVTKTFTGRENDEWLTTDEFSFTLSAADDATAAAVTNGTVVMPTATIKATSTNHNPSFGALTFKAVGTYNFVITEAAQTNGITASVTSVPVTVTVGYAPYDGKLHAAVVYGNDVNATSAVFVNTYGAEGVTVTGLAGTKTLTGRDLVAGEFAFKLETNDDATAAAVANQTVVLGGTALQTSMLAYNAADGSWSFGDIRFEKAGTYLFKVSEVAAGTLLPGVTYDTTTYNVTVVVTDNGQGALVAEVQKPESGFAFSNAYASDVSQSPTVYGTKVLTGRTLQAGEFSFALSGYRIEGSLTASNAADGSFSFTLPTLTMADLADVTADGSGVRTKTFNYALTEVVPAAEYQRPGVAYSDASYSIAVTLTDDGQGNLTTATAITDKNGESVDQIVFENAYAPNAGCEIQLDAIKTLTGRDLPEGAFSFAVEDATGELVTLGSNDAATLGEGTSASGAVSFSPISYDAGSMVGATQNEDGTRTKTFSYTMYEIDPGASSRMPGVSTYDDSVYTVDVTVVDDGEGSLDIASVVYGNGTEQLDDQVPEFVNHYTVADGEFVPTGISKATEALEGTDLSNVTFSFAIYPQGDRTTPVATGTSGANGLVTFTAIPVTGVGEFWYDIVEDHQGTTVGGVTYDAAVYQLQLVVTDAGDGTYGITPGYYVDKTPLGDNLFPVFYNTYNAEDLYVSIDGVTKLVNDAAPGERQFMFELYDETTGATQYGHSNSDGTVEFGDLHYQYRVVSGPVTADLADADASTEDEQPVVDGEPVSGDVQDDQPVEPAPGDETQDQPVEPEPVVDESDNSANAATDGTQEGQSGEPVPGDVQEDQPIIEDAAIDPLNGEGEELSLAGVFDATVAYATDEEAAQIELTDLPAVEESGLVDEQMPAAVTLDEQVPSDLGEHWYTLTEVVPEGATQNADGSWTYRGVTYDTTKYRFCVTVSDNGDGTLKAEFTEIYRINGNDVVPVTSMSDVVFRNTYEVTEPVQVTFEASKVLTGRDARAGEFAFAVRTSDGNLLVSGESKAAAAGEAAPVVFAPLWLDAAGVYYMYIEEVNGGQTIAGVTYDAQVVFACVTVTDQGDGTFAAQVEYFDGNQTPLESAPVFTNSYAIDVEGVASIEVGKVLHGRDAAAGEFSFAIYNGDDMVAGGQSPALKDGEVATFKLGNVYFKEAGEYDLTVVEVAQSASTGVTYDATSFNVHVSVTDQGDGTLACEVAYPQGGIVFENSYTAAPATVRLVADKTLTGRTLAAGEFSFRVTDAVTGELVATGVNDGDGLVYFNEFTLDKSGSYNFVITEVAGTEAGMTYDNRSFTAHVEVTDNGLGQLVAEVSYPDGNARFKNTFTPAAPSVPKTSDATLSTGVMVGVGVAGICLIGAGALLVRKLRRSGR